MRNAPFTFQRLMDIVLKGKKTFCITYIEVSLSTGAEHIGHVNEVLEVLQKKDHTAKPSSVSGEWGQLST